MRAGHLARGLRGANRKRVSEIVSELRRRLKTRGQSGQFRRQVTMLKVIAEIERLVALAAQGGGGGGSNIAYPPAPQVMALRVGGKRDKDGRTAHHGAKRAHEHAMGAGSSGSEGGPNPLRRRRGARPPPAARGQRGHGGRR